MESCFSAVPGVGVVYSINIPMYTWQDNVKQIFSLQCIHSSEHFFLKLRIKGFPLSSFTQKNSDQSCSELFHKTENWRHTPPLHHASTHHEAGIHASSSTEASTNTVLSSSPAHPPMPQLQGNNLATQWSGSFNSVACVLNTSYFTDSFYIEELLWCVVEQGIIHWLLQFSGTNACIMHYLITRLCL